MVQQHTTYGATPTIDLVKRGIPPSLDPQGLKRPFDGVAPLVGQGSGVNTGKSLDYTSFKRSCLVAHGGSHIEASEIHSNTNRSTQVANVSEYTQRRLAASTPTPTLNPLLRLSHPRYGLPPSLVRNFASLGINSIYPWQSSCLLGRGILDGEQNLVYSAPTGGGKSLVGDVLMLKRIIEDPTKKAILVLPYVALVQEKLQWLRKVLDGVDKNVIVDSSSAADPTQSRWRKPQQARDVRVAGFFGGSKAFRGTNWRDVDIAVCTFEKANYLVNQSIERCTIDDLAVVVLDELHMIDDGHRGYLMELLATKLLSLERSVQIIGMSATLSNTEMIAKWLNAKHYISNYKPVPLEEFLVFNNAIYPTSISSELLGEKGDETPIEPALPLADRLIKLSASKELSDPVSNSVVALAIETATTGFGALVFCRSRQRCQMTALLISRAMPTEHNIPEEVIDQRKEVISDLRNLPVGLDDNLADTVIAGVAFHHAGLTIEERALIAEAYDRGILKVIVATCSLAAGINLPARRVIIQEAYMGKDPIGPAMLRQMRGRAGRKGKDEVGESYLCCNEHDVEQVAQLLETDLPKVESSLTPEKRGIKRALLEVITIKLATHEAAISEYVQRTLLAHTLEKKVLDSMVESAIQDLIDEGFLTIDRMGSYNATRLSQATVGSFLTPEDGLIMHAELQQALRAFVMDGEMHIFYLFTPVRLYGLVDINWQIFRREMEGLDDSGLRVLGFINVNPALVNKMANSGSSLPENTEEEIRVARIYRRCYIAFHLRDLCNEMPIYAIARKYDSSRGFVQTLAQTCEGFAAGTIQFCDRMGWGMLKSVFEHMSDRLKAGARADLLDLAKVPFVKSRTARVLWDNGFKSLMAVAEADPKDLLPVLIQAQPSKTWIYGDDEEKFRRKVMLKAEIIVSSANRLWGLQQQVEIEADV